MLMQWRGGVKRPPVPEHSSVVSTTCDTRHQPHGWRSPPLIRAHRGQGVRVDVEHGGWHALRGQPAQTGGGQRQTEITALPTLARRPGDAHLIARRLLELLHEWDATGPEPSECRHSASVTGHARGGPRALTGTAADRGKRYGTDAGSWPPCWRGVDHGSRPRRDGMLGHRLEPLRHRFKGCVGDRLRGLGRHGRCLLPRFGGVRPRLECRVSGGVRDGRGAAGSSTRSRAA